MTNSFSAGKILSRHTQRSAIVYVRQSSPQQVLEHQESTARQYALVERAVELGWPRSAVDVIDEDLGRSGQSIEGRLGFQRLLANVALDQVGLILGLEMSRLARSNKDWHHLLELCARFHTLLADADGVYDPTLYHDRLLLGLSGMMSEAELHVLKERMHQGKLNKARRGELFNHPPIGYIKDAGGRPVIDPDEQVQAVVRLVFDQFDRQGSLHGLLRYLVHHQIRLPVRPHFGPNRGQLEWRRPNRHTLQNLLRHPIYAGAYRYGHRPTDPRKQQPGRPGTGRGIRPPHECEVLIRDHLPAYITWERFCANVQRLDDNRARHPSVGAPRQGETLLGGLLKCGRCGRRMLVAYGGHNNHHTYSCNRATSTYAVPLCQSLSGPCLDALVGEQLLAAVAPAALQASLAAVADIERERADLLKHWQLRLERARQEADRAERQYQACEPENRLVARQLESRWEEALNAQRQLQEEFDRWRRTAPVHLSAADEATIRSLAEDVPALWQAETTTPADRQRVARLLIDQLRVTVDKASDRVDVEIHWVGGCRQSHVLDRPVSRYDQQSQYPQLVKRLRELSDSGLSSKQVAERLNADGFRPPKRTPRFTGPMVLRLLREEGLSRRPRHGSTAGLGPDEYRVGSLSARLGVKRDTVRRWLRSGWLTAWKDEGGHHVIWADADELERLQELHRLPRTWENRARLQELQKPKPRPTC